MPYSPEPARSAALVADRPGPQPSVDLSGIPEHELPVALAAVGGEVLPTYPMTQRLDADVVSLSGGHCGQIAGLVRKCVCHVVVLCGGRMWKV